MSSSYPKNVENTPSYPWYNEMTPHLSIVLQAMCEEADLREMGIPMGPRKKLLGFLRELKEKQVNILYFTYSTIVSYFSNNTVYFVFFI